MKKKLQKGIILVILTLFVVSATIFAAKAAFSINFSPLSGAPGDSIGVSSLTGDFKALTTVGIGIGAEVTMTNEAVTVTETGINSAEGFTANHPIKPGSFSWSAPFGALTFMVFDNPFFDVIFIAVVFVVWVEKICENDLFCNFF